MIIWLFMVLTAVLVALVGLALCKAAGDADKANDAELARNDAELAARRAKDGKRENYKPG